ncbi:MAG: hypothetical protein Q4P20_02635 [Eubacteriales bacterium]|nr:hypothetical protein [Eubacteriales bacterium]
MKRNFYLIFILVAGLCGAALRCTCLLYGYEAETGLPKEGYLPAMLLVALTAIVVIVAAVLSRTWFQPCAEKSFEQLFGGMPWSGILCLLCGIGMAVFSVQGILWLPDQLAEQYLFEGNEIIMPSPLITGATALVWVLSFAAGMCVIVLSVWQRGKKPAGKRTGLLTTIPMFWCCLDLIMVYHQNSGNPVLSDYSYTLLLIIAVMTAFYSMGGFLYAAKRPAARFFASAGVAVYLALMQMGGMAVWSMLETSGMGILQLLGTGTALRMDIYLMTGIYLLLQLGHAINRSRIEAQ